MEQDVMTEELFNLKTLEEAMLGFKQGHDDHVGTEYEKINAVAVKYEGIIYLAEKPLRHDSIVHELHEKFGKSISSGQGFYTSFNRFLDRTEAAELALKNGQIKCLSVPPNLFSEDLW